MGSHCPFGHLKHKLWSKERLKIKLVVWLPTIKSQELTQFPRVQTTCDIPLKISRRGLQLWFKAHRNWRSARKVMGSQSCKSPSSENFETPIWESRNKNHLDVAPVERCRVYYKGEGGGFPQVQVVVNLVSLSCLWLVLTPKMFLLCTNHLVLVLCKSVWIVKACQFFLIPSQSSSTPSTPLKCCKLRVCPDFLLFHCFQFKFTFESLKDLGAHQQGWLVGQIQKKEPFVSWPIPSPQSKCFVVSDHHSITMAMW